MSLTGMSHSRTVPHGAATVGRRPRAGSSMARRPDAVRPLLHLRRVGTAVEARGTMSWRSGEGDLFAEWHWDGRRLQIQTDRYAFQPLFYAVGQGEIRLSPSLLTLLEDGVPPDLDDAGLAVFLRFGFFIGDQTAFQAIRVVPARARLEWRDGELIRTEIPWPITVSSLSRSRAIEAFADLFRTAVRRRLEHGHPTAVPLSGGRDSRHILFELCAAGRPPVCCLSYLHPPPRKNNDAAIAGQVCAELRLPHVLLQQPRSRLQADLRMNRDTHFSTDEMSEYFTLADHVAGRYPVLYDGIAGDVFTSGMLYNTEHEALWEAGRIEELANVLLDAFPMPGGYRHETVLAALLPAEQYRRLNRELVVDAVCREMRRYADHPNPLGSFFFWNRTRREIALGPTTILGGAATVYCPYLDAEVHDLLASLPPRHGGSKRFHTEAIHLAHPARRLLPFEEDIDTPFLVDEPYFRRFARELTWYTVRRPSRFIRHSYLLPRLVKGMFDGDYTCSSFFAYRWFGPHVIYLLQLERLIRDLPARGK